jgi:flagellar biogenesis protein FliO
VNALVHALGFAAALFCAAPTTATAQQPAPPRAVDSQAAKQPIPFRKDDSLGDMALSAAGGLIVAIGAAIGVLYVLRRYTLAVRNQPGRRVRVIETVRLGPKCALFLVEVDGRGLLVGQQGDTLAVLDHPSDSPSRAASGQASIAAPGSSTPHDHAA